MLETNYLSASNCAQLLLIIVVELDLATVFLYSCENDNGIKSSLCLLSLYAGYQSERKKSRITCIPFMCNHKMVIVSLVTQLCVSNGHYGLVGCYLDWVYLAMQ